MIFPYDPPQHVAFWMKNTLIPLDMVFIRADGTIARIATAKPLDRTPVPAGEPVAAVLEIARRPRPPNWASARATRSRLVTLGRLASSRA